MIRVNVPSKIPSGIFVHDEIIQMHTIHENNYQVVKEPRNGNSKANEKLTNFLVKSTEKFFSDLSSQFVSPPQNFILRPILGRDP